MLTNVKWMEPQIVMRMQHVTTLMEVLNAVVFLISLEMEKSAIVLV